MQARCARTCTTTGRRYAVGSVMRRCRQRHSAFPARTVGPRRTVVSVSLAAHPDDWSCTACGYPLDYRSEPGAFRQQIPVEWYHPHLGPQDHKPVPAAQVSGTATVLVNGQSHKVELSPAEANSLTGKLPLAAQGKVVATVSLKVGGKPASARFAGAA